MLMNDAVWHLKDDVTVVVVMTTWCCLASSVGKPGLCVAKLGKLSLHTTGKFLLLNYYQSNWGGGRISDR